MKGGGGAAAEREQGMPEPERQATAGGRGGAAHPEGVGRRRKEGGRESR